MKKLVYVKCALCKRTVGKYRSAVVKWRVHFCSRACHQQSKRLYSQYLADGRFAAVLARELEQIKALNRAQVVASLAPRSD
jgi:hypothetical protein